MAYDKQVWRNGDRTTPLSEDRLNHIEDGIFEASTRTLADVSVVLVEDPPGSGLYAFSATEGA